MSGTVIYLGSASPQTSSVLPEAWRAAILLLHGLASDGVYNAQDVTTLPVVSYTAISPLPFPPPEGFGNGGIFSAALSLGSLPPDVIRHPAL